ncbi:MAG: aspartate carbamoyltransferase [Aquificaceae bacterium]
MRHIISTRDLTKGDIEEIYGLFKEFKKGKKEKIEGDAALVFLESSTRTRFSFERACRLLGLRTYFAGRGETSIEKGETFYETVRTLSTVGFRVLIFRVPFVLFPYEKYLREKICLINAGDGTHQHPTQGFIDLFTAFEVYGSVEGLKVLYVGDIFHSRVFRSGSYLFKMYDAHLGVCAPRTLLPSDLSAFGVDRVFDHLDEAIDWANLIIQLRLQEERFRENHITSKESYFLQFGLTKERHEKLIGYFMHPGPVNLYVDVDGDILYSPKSLVTRQVENGLYVRMAVVYRILKDD